MMQIAPYKYLGLVLFLAFGAISLLLSCDQLETTHSTQQASTVGEGQAKFVDEMVNPNFQFNYQLKNANAVCNLPASLIEISALSFDTKHQELLAVNDEMGKIFCLDFDSCTIKKTVDFSGKGDYEGIEKIGDIVYIVKSNGNLYPINLDQEEKMPILKSPLSTSNDIEGLGYDQKTHQLILACKGAPNIDKTIKTKHTKAFYAFDLKTKVLNTQPHFVITDEHLITFFNQHLTAKDHSKKDQKKLIKRLKSFSPSAIAQHPIDGNFYILSSVGRLLIVVTHQGAVQSIQFLNPKQFSQPEGICFTPKGDMYVSNEGRSLIAKIFRFDYQVH